MIKLREQESDYQCLYQHQKPIVAIALNKSSSLCNRFLCADCIKNFEKNIMTMGWRTAIEKIESELQHKHKVIETLITPFLKLLKEFQSDLEQFRIAISNQIDQVLSIVNQWQQDLHNEKQKQVDYKFLEELEYIVQKEITQQSSQYFEDKIRNQIKELQSKWIVQVESKLSQLSKFEQLNSCQEKLKLIDKQRKIQIIKLKKELELPLIKLDSTEIGVQYYLYDTSQKSLSNNYKTVIFIGQKEQGKTTLIDAFVNYYFDIKFDDNFRLRVSNNEPTSKATHYMIPPYGSRTYGFCLIDTPSFHNKNDSEIMNLIINLILNCKDQLTLVFCLKAENTRNAQESVQTLQDILAVTGQHQEIKLVIVRTLFSNENINTINTEDDLYLNELEESYNLDINANNVLRKNKSTKTIFKQSMEKLQQIEFQEQNLSLSVKMQLVSNRVSNNTNYSPIFYQSYNQLKQLFLQNVQIYNKNKQQQYLNNMITLYYLKRVEKQVNTFQFNCDYHLLTCLTGFRNQINAVDCWAILNNQCICGCTKERISINYQQISYEEECTITCNDEVYQENILINKLALRRIFYFLFNLYIYKSQNQQFKQSQFFEILKKEEQFKDNIDLELCQQVCLGQFNKQQNVQQNQQYYKMQNNQLYPQQHLALNSQAIQKLPQNQVLNNEQYTPQRIQQNNQQDFFFNNQKQAQMPQNVHQLNDKQGQFQQYPIINRPNPSPGQNLQTFYPTLNNQGPTQNTMRF
ncbi:unnamed protein product (macronuclear) [Paramecium tetraurelia]|uniref:G domain-containing protein n=1 Tax=Paramecium tetraurelia TaxID=5888 RepID=A0CHY8_PARTE|nr:uncharacterized protein GSPATT00038507001 [Paramecium tetraurelia]CAK70405.1 unnamed protein product [Paramecium tetraurelia]|eukprot:XP_001437802.1 hypothetical protein (macronuclear) [Paramecium tetraurelia strain d4-2]